MSTDIWQYSVRLWKLLGPPLRPSPEDIATVERWLGDPILATPQARVLVLGATPEYHALPWPAGIEPIAVDRSQSMLGLIWPGRESLCADWRELPYPDASVHMMLCDAGMTLQTYPQGQREVVTAVARKTAPGGLVILRQFLQPARHESLDEVVAALQAGALSDLNQLKLRLWIAMQESPEEGVENQAYWNVVLNAVPDRRQLARLLRMSVADLDLSLANIDQRRYRLTDEPVLTGWFLDSPGGFRLEEKFVPGYACGDCCPTFVFRRNQE